MQLYTQFLLKLDQLKSLAKVLLSNIYVIVTISFYDFLKNCNVIRLELYDNVKQRFLTCKSMSFYTTYI